MSATSIAAPSLGPSGSRPRIAAVYHRPLDAAYHGSSIHCRSFVQGLGYRLDVEVVAPRERSPTGLDEGSNEPQLVGFRYLIASAVEQGRFALREVRRGSGERARAIAAFDIYGAGFAAIWSALRSVPLVYYPLDSNRAVGRDWSQSGYKGGLLFRLARAPLQWAALRRAWRVVVPSPAVGADLEAEGVEPGRVRVCTLKRDLPVERASDTEEWRERLGLHGRIGIVFVGSFQYAPNVRAFEFVRTVLAPLFRSTDPDALLLIAGLDSESHRSESTDNLRVLGTVKDLDGLLFASSIGLAPTDVAGGTSGKVVDYVLHGLEVVATPEAAQGLEDAPDLVVARLSEFAAAVRKVCERLRSRTGGAPRLPPSPEFVDRYTRSGDLDRLALEIIARVE